jgi:hypothetical protein
MEHPRANVGAPVTDVVRDGRSIVTDTRIDLPR